MIHAFVVSAIMFAGVASDATVETTAERVERSARDYRLAVYESYHTDRANFDIRYNLGLRMRAGWLDAGQPDEYAERLINWFETSLNTDHPTMPAWITDLEREANANIERRNLAKPERTSPDESNPIVVEPVNETVPVVETDPVSDAAATEAVESAPNSLLESIGKSLLRATINATDDGSRFE